ncbi:outer membrane protein OmpA-like peptidoglycan-associated protein [Leeuwenhoekiella aestuarii]|uniref:Outer membrane protein OmpA-like peptidoglycan-associated protein n=1 Tax=Leeuwenhoekiella aestuarii TaxID=2249426 RepID=A0A4Q0NRV8_9FLAO|nr:OmpA family protein [Leeuwenhoekiella aestuarii]RXG13412.1 outer membrane protein OmpA-like peptidoglycan-associated protein [Leeuwenhoekiella aestuarii]RXG14857.1 outer membrane protein OmpA-like peptidoglycan-associated protein [Leeuwenhoekiella aestuarii]
MKTILKNVSVLAVAITMLTGCEATKNANNQQKGTVIGAAGGAILGAVIGNNVGKKGDGGELGAVIGGVVGGAAGNVIGKKMDKQAQRIEEEIPGAEVERVDDGIVVNFDENSGVYFATNKYDINAASQQTLDGLAKVMAEYPKTNVLVVGHTDSTGSAEYNMTLSKNRAQAVTNYLSSHGVSAGRFTTQWYGEEQPKYTNETAEGRSKNRRVTLAIVPNQEMVNEAKQEAGEGQ